MLTGLTIPFTGLRKQYNNLRTEILDATDEVLRSGQLMNGNNTAEFEAWLARRNHVHYAVTCHSGTHALEILASYWAMESPVPHPPTALIPSMTYVATANAFIRAGWDIHIIDTDIHGLIDVNKIPDNVSYQVIVMVGLYGAAVTHHGNVRAWHQWVQRDTLIIEDAAQHWLAADGVRTGRGGAAISFDPMKNLACYGNGGAIVTNDLNLAEYARAWRDNGKPSHHNPGTNSRMSELDCAHMLIKSKHIDRWQARRQKIADHWCDRFKNTAIRCLIDDSNAHDHAVHKFVIDVNNRDILKANLDLRKIETRVHYASPLHEMSLYSAYPGPGLLAVSSSLARRVLSLPIYPELTDLEVEYITDQVLDCVA
jgi:dTDP-4-amino-4,6-dideoxygalactose transaminase